MCLLFQAQPPLDEIEAVTGCLHIVKATIRKGMTSATLVTMLLYRLILEKSVHPDSLFEFTRVFFFL